MALIDGPYYNIFKISYPYTSQHTLTHRELFLNGKYCVSDNTKTVAWFADEKHAQLFCAANNAKHMDQQVEALAYNIWFDTVQCLNYTGMLLPQPDKKSPAYESELKFYENVSKALNMYFYTWDNMSEFHKKQFMEKARLILNRVIGLPKEKFIQQETEDESHN